MALQAPVFAAYSAPFTGYEQGVQDTNKVQCSLMMNRECFNRVNEQFDFLVQKIWLFGLCKPFCEMAIAAAEDTAKPMDEIVRNVQAHFFSLSGKDK